MSHAMSFVTMNLVTMMYLIASVCFIQALKGLSSPSTARRGNAFGMSGMAIAAVTTVALILKLKEQQTGGMGLTLVIIGIVTGGAIGAYLAKTVEMTKMPELVAAMHSLIGLAAVCIAVAAVSEPWAFNIAKHGEALPIGNRFELFIGTFVGAITQWAENVYLPQFYDRALSAYRATEYTLKAGAALDKQALAPIDLLLYGAVLILRHEPSYAKSKGLKFLDIARELGSERAVRMLEEGSGSFPDADIRLNNALLECRANDVFATISITIAREEEAAYAQALVFITHLLDKGFPKSCQIKLKSRVKEYLPIKGLAKSDTHRFFANALAYAGLQPQLEAYARAAIVQFEFYADTEGEKNCMPGSYATFGLGLLDARYFPLVQHYMANVDEEHQSVQDQFTAAFAEQHGVTRDSAPVLAACLRACTDNAKVKIQAELDEVEKLELFCQQLQGLDGYLVEHMLYPVWGKLEKLAALARKAQGRRKELLLALLEAASRADA